MYTTALINLSIALNSDAFRGLSVALLIFIFILYFVNRGFTLWRIATGAQSPLHDQAADMARFLKRSIARHSMKAQTGRLRAVDPSEKRYYEEYAESRVTFEAHADTGLWSQQVVNAGTTAHIEDVCSWMQQCLAPENA